MERLCLRLFEIHAVHLLRLFLRLAEVCSNSVAQLSKFRSTVVSLAETETHLGNFLIDFLHAVIVLQQVQTLFVRFPDEFQPWGKHVTVSTILLGLATDGTEQQTK